MTWHVALALAIAAAAFFDGVCDAIKDYRTHIALHPYRDFYHVCKHAMRGALVAIGFVFPMSWWEGPWAMWGIVLIGVPLAKWAVWDPTYRAPWVWFRLDETWRISTGIPWLDKFLGLHH